jgi:hypothetical protein
METHFGWLGINKLMVSLSVSGSNLHSERFYLTDLIANISLKQGHILVKKKLNSQQKEKLLLVTISIKTVS